MKIGIIGCGNLGTSILKGIISNHPEKHIVASKRKPEKLTHLMSDTVTITADNAHLIQECSLLVFTLKPYNVLPFIQEYREYLQPEKHTIISTATGISIQEIQEMCGTNIGVYRAMPNTATAVGESITAIAGNEDPLQRTEAVFELFNTVGETVAIDESLMDAATILGACGIAYVLRFMRAMIQGGIEVGFDATTATKIVSQTIKGASELIIQNNTHPEQEIDKVTTPKGCTIVGLNEMEHAGFSSSLIKGIVSSYRKIEG